MLGLGPLSTKPLSFVNLGKESVYKGVQTSATVLVGTTTETNLYKGVLKLFP